MLERTLLNLSGSEYRHAQSLADPEVVGADQAFNDAREFENEHNRQHA